VKPLQNPYPGGGCFFCGPKNPIGLKLDFFITDGEPQELVCRWQPGQHYRGLGDVLHGGIQCGLFDEIMGWTTHFLIGPSAVTGELKANFLKPVRLGQEIEVRCRIAEIKGREVWLEAEIKNSDGQVCTKARGSYVQISEERFNAIMGPPE
jgi:uncharacterized protein (TIGR00369 family)